MTKPLGIAAMILLGIAHMFIPDTVHLLDTAIFAAAWFGITVPLGEWLLKRAKSEPVKELSELERLWLEVGPPHDTAGTVAVPAEPAVRPAPAPVHKPASKAEARARLARARAVKPACTHLWRAGTCRNCPLRPA